MNNHKRSMTNANYMMRTAVVEWIKSRQMMVMMLSLIICLLSFSRLAAQEISYAGTPRHCEIGGLAVEGVEGYEDFVVLGLSGLEVGQMIDIPGAEITEAVKRYWTI